MRNKIFTLLFAVLASVGTMFAAGGTCGENLTWDYTNGVLTISGTGAMTDFVSGYDTPWSNGSEYITSIVINEGVTSIGDWAFRNCSACTSITIPNGVTSIGQHAFYGCSSLASISIPNSVTSIGEWAFCMCTRLTSATIGNNVTSIGEYAFYECTGLTSVEIPNSVTNIGRLAFSGCTDLLSVTIGNSVTSIEFRTFENCSSLTSVVIGNSVTSIGSGAFKDCSSLTSVTMGNNIASIGNYAFGKCAKLTSIEIPESVTSIEPAAFYECTGLTSVTIGNRVNSIGEWAFGKCPELTSIEIPNSVTSIGLGAFYGCDGLTSINVVDDNPNYCSVEGVLFNKDTTTLVEYPGGKQGAYSIPNKVSIISENAFTDCTYLTSVTIPSKVTQIADDAFSGCTGLTSITCLAMTPPAVGERGFEEVDKSIPLYVPANRVLVYKTTSPWSEWGDNIKPIQSAEVEVIDLNANPTDNIVIIEWPKADGAVVYAIEIKKTSELICTLEFNEFGQLLSIAFASPARSGSSRKQPAAIQTSTGWQYTITGLDANTEYTYTVTAKQSDNSVVYSKSIPFKTEQTATGVDQITNEQSPMTNKVLRNGQLFILRGEKVWTITGAEVR